MASVKLMVMSKQNLFFGRKGERGATLVEFAIGGAVFLTVLFAVLEFGRLLWTHNELTNATRRGARYAALHSYSDATKVRNVVVCGTETECTSPVVHGLTVEKVKVVYSENYYMNEGAITVSIEPTYQFRFVTTFFGISITMPKYQTTLTAESAGVHPPDI